MGKKSKTSEVFFGVNGVDFSTSFLPLGKECTLSDTPFLFDYLALEESDVFLYRDDWEKHLIGCGTIYIMS